MSPEFWTGQRVLVTGHTGFKGAWLAFWLRRLGAQVTGLSLPPADTRGAFCAFEPWPGLRSHLLDIRNRQSVAGLMAGTDPQVVFHLAAQPIVRAGFADPVATYEVNVMGTVNLMAALDVAPSLRAVVVVTTDKVYTQEGGDPFTEGDRIGGDDAYSASKACAELIVKAWPRSGSPPRVATARAGNVIGGGDVAPDRLLPDTRRALSSNAVLRLRYPEAVRPWQFVLEPLYGYLLLAERLATHPGTTPSAVNFGPAEDGCIPVHDLVARVFRRAGGGKWEPESCSQPHEAAVLRLDPSLAQETLGWRPRLDIDEAIDWTLEWWRAEEEGGNLKALASRQIEHYEKLLLR